MVLMKNNKGFGRYEVLTVIVLLMAAFSLGGYFLFNMVTKQKIQTMKDNALSFSKAVSMNISSFHYTDVVYLEEAVDAEVFPNVINPFGGGICDNTQSRVNIADGQTYTTLRCGDYLIDEATFKDIDNVEIFKVSEWSSKKVSGKDVEERVLYNCKEDGKDVFDNYSEEFLFVYEYNKKYETDYYFANDIPEDNCEVVSKTFYRTLKKAN